VLLRRVRGRLAPWIAWERYRRLTLRWGAAQSRRCAFNEPALPARIRPVQRSELERFAGDPAYDISARFLERLEPRPDLCLGAFLGAELAGYAFVSAAPTQIDESLRFHFPERWLYVYKAFARPNVRGKRLFNHIFLDGIPLIEQWLGPIEEPIGFVTLVRSDNQPSLKAFGRIGFRPEEDFAILRLRARPYLLAVPRLEAPEFFIEKVGNGEALA
jgi:hypothetical protein